MRQYAVGLCATRDDLDISMDTTGRMLKKLDATECGKVRGAVFQDIIHRRDT